MNEPSSSSSSTPLAKYKLLVSQRYQVLLDTLTPKLVLRWAITAVLFIVSKEILQTYNNDNNTQILFFVCFYINMFAVKFEKTIKIDLFFLKKTKSYILLECLQCMDSTLLLMVLVFTY